MATGKQGSEYQFLPRPSRASDARTPFQEPFDLELEFVRSQCALALRVQTYRHDLVIRNGFGDQGTVRLAALFCPCSQPLVEP